MNIGGQVLLRDLVQGQGPQGPQGWPQPTSWWRILDIIVTWRPDLTPDPALDIFLSLVAPDGQKRFEVYYHVLDARSAAAVEAGS